VPFLTLRAIGESVVIKTPGDPIRVTLKAILAPRVMLELERGGRAETYCLVKGGRPLICKVGGGAVQVEITNIHTRSKAILCLDAPREWPIEHG
jgi:hypothetical protein